MTATVTFNLKHFTLTAERINMLTAAIDEAATAAKNDTLLNGLGVEVTSLLGNLLHEDAIATYVMRIARLLGGTTRTRVTKVAKATLADLTDHQFAYAATGHGYTLSARLTQASEAAQAAMTGDRDAYVTAAANLLVDSQIAQFTAIDANN